MFFPTEAKLAMEIAHAETTAGLAGLLSSRGSSGNLMEVDLNETPVTQKKRLVARIETLSRTGIITIDFFARKKILNFVRTCKFLVTTPEN